MDTLVRTARLTGVWYLSLALTGLFGFLIVRPRLFVEDDAGATLANLVEQEALARTGVALELGIVLTQALAAVWFYRLFRGVAPVAAGSIAAFGLVNSVAIMGSAAMLATAVDIAHAPVGDAAASVQTLFLVSGNLWGAGNLFFGLWLIPMGICVLQSRWTPTARLDPHRRRRWLRARRVHRFRVPRCTGRRRFSGLAGERGGALDGRLPADPRHPPYPRGQWGHPRARRSALGHPIC